MWLLFAFGSALFAGLTAILAKIGIRDTDSNLATAIRTVVVLVFAWLMALLSVPEGQSLGGQLAAIAPRSWLFLVLSGFATGASWLCYFRALSLGPASLVTPVDKTSTILTMLLAFLLLQESLGLFGWLGMAVIALGTALMVLPQRGAPKQEARRGWLFFAFGSALFAALTGILGKLGIEGVPSNLGTAIRTVVVLFFAWLMVFLTGRQEQLRRIDARSWLFLLLSGLATGASWLCYYRALQTGPASVVVPIDKLSILPTVAFAWLFLGEKLGKRALAGLALLTGGTLLLLF